MVYCSYLQILGLWEITFRFLEIVLHIVHTIVHIWEIALNILEIALTVHWQTGPSRSQYIYIYGERERERDLFGANLFRGDPIEMQCCTMMPSLNVWHLTLSYYRSRSKPWYLDGPQNAKWILSPSQIYGKKQEKPTNPNADHVRKCM